MSARTSHSLTVFALRCCCCFFAAGLLPAATVLAVTHSMNIANLTIWQNESWMDCHIIYNRQNISTYIQTLQPIVGRNEFRIALDLQAIASRNMRNYRPDFERVDWTNYLDQTLDYCGFLASTRKGNSLMSFVYGKLLYYNNTNTNLPDRCPIEADTYYTKDYSLSNDLYPSLLPRFYFRLTFEWFIELPKRLRILSVRLRGIVTTLEKGQQRRKRRPRPKPQ